MNVNVVHGPLHGWTIKPIDECWQWKPGGTQTAILEEPKERLPAVLRAKVRLTLHTMIANRAHSTYISHSGLRPHQCIMQTSVHPRVNIVRGKIGPHSAHSSSTLIKGHF
jgi:hypothetical protein